MIMRSRRRRSKEVALALLAFLPAWGALVAGLYVTVTDSSTGNTLGGLRCALFNEAQALVSSSVNKADTKSCRFTLGTGGATFSLTIERDGFYPVSKGGIARSTSELQVELTRRLKVASQTKQFRVVLSWGNHHPDLDSHLVVPKSTTSASCVVSYENKNCGSANLDVDDTDSWGPETVTMTNPHPGIYSYFVYIYGGGGGRCWDKGIRASVSVWSGQDGGLLKTLSNPKENDNRCGAVASPTCHLYWHVFNLDATTNTYTWTNKIVPSKVKAVLDAAAALPSATGCRCSTYRTSGQWTDLTKTSSTKLYDSMLGVLGVGGIASCHYELQNFFKAAVYNSVTEAAAAAAARLAKKVNARFEGRKSAARALRDRAQAWYTGSATKPSYGGSLKQMCKDSCTSCVYNAGFRSNVNIHGWGARFGARSGAPGSALMKEDEVIAKGLGDSVVGIGGFFEQDPTAKWTYYGSEQGVNVIAPQQVGKLSKCNGYDPRLRPWYTEAVSRLKNVVVVMDASVGVDEPRLLKLKQAVRAVLGTLAAGDTANVVVARSNGTAPSVPGDTAGSDPTYRACQQQQMLRTVPVNKRLLSRFVGEVRPQSASTGSGAAALGEALRTAQALLRSQRSHAKTHHPNISSSDLVVVVAASELQSSAAEYNRLKAELSPPATWLLHALGPLAVSSSQLAKSVDLAQTLSDQDVGFQPARYSTLAALQLTNASTAPFASAFYEDSSGLGLVSTVVAPVYAGSTLRGVVGIDVTVLELVGDLVFDREWTSSYAFIVDAAGQAVWHPALPSPGDSKGVEPVNILDLEVSSGFEKSVMPGLMAGSTGSATVSVDMVQARGDATYAGFGRVVRAVTFAWHPIEGTSFRLCVALTPQDKTTKTLRFEGTQSHGGCKGACEVYHNVALGQTCGTRLVGGNVPGRSSVFYAASAFTNPSGWLDHRETEANAEAIAKANTCTSKDLPSFGKAVGSLKAAAVNDNAIARQVDSCWKAKEMDGIDLKATVVWQYFGSANGVFRSMPGHTVKKRYDATQRPWYLAAVANRDPTRGYGPTISTPYLDSSGAGIVITISRAVTRGGPTDPVAGVVGVDVKLAEVKRLVNQQSGCASSSVRCMLLSETGHVIYHPDFAASAEETSEEVFLSKKHREVTAVLVKGGILQQQTCMDYASGMRKTSYKVVLGSSNSAGGTLLCGKWALSRLGGTKGNSNAYLLALSSNGCITGQKAAAACVPCDESNCKKWSSLGSALLCQPCRCKIMYDSCNLNYHTNGSAKAAFDACPASPAPLFSNLCPLKQGPQYITNGRSGALTSAGRCASLLAAALVLSLSFAANVAI